MKGRFCPTRGVRSWGKSAGQTVESPEWSASAFPKQGKIPLQAKGRSFVEASIAKPYLGKVKGTKDILREGVIFKGHQGQDRTVFFFYYRRLTGQEGGNTARASGKTTCHKTRGDYCSAAPTGCLGQAKSLSGLLDSKDTAGSARSIKTNEGKIIHVGVDSSTVKRHAKQGRC